MDYNYHMHTFRCHHATGEDEEYILKAIENGIKYLGVSEHIPLKFSDGFEASYRMFEEDAENYIESFRSLREKYKDSIDIKIGFEMEYYPLLFEKMLEKAREYGGEFLILGEHFFFPEHPAPRYVCVPDITNEELEAYANTTVEGMKTNVFSYLAHPDVIVYNKDIDFYKEQMRKICVAARELNLPMEINFLGIRDNRHYPNEAFWQVAGEEKAPVTFGLDAHDINACYDSLSVKRANELIDKFNLKYIGKPEIKEI